MAPRVDSELLLVGSLPADSADSALRAAAAFYDGLVFALPDGETGPRSAWVGYERERLVRPNPERGRGAGNRVADRHPAARVRDPGVRHPARRHRAALGFLAAHRRRDRRL